MTRICPIQINLVNMVKQDNHQLWNIHALINIEQHTESKVIDSYQKSEYVQEESDDNKPEDSEIYIDPAQYFSKMIADFIKEVDCIAMSMMRRVTLSGNIVTVKPEQPDDGFCVMFYVQPHRLCNTGQIQ